MTQLERTRHQLTFKEVHRLGLAREKVIWPRTAEVLLVAGTLLVGPLTSPVVAQDRNRLELQAGGGFVWGGGAEDPGPSLATYDVGFVLWDDKWGVAARYVRGPGQDRAEWANSDSYIGSGNLRYTTVTARRRWFLAGSTELNVGFGLMLGGSFEDLDMRRSRVVATESVFSGFSFEALVGHRFSRHFGVKWGLTQDCNPETVNTQLVGLGVIGF